MDPIRQLWSQGNFRALFTPPKILYAFNENDERFIVIKDDGTVYRLMNSRGQVFMVAHFRCEIDKNGQFYRCKGLMHIVSCTKHSSDVDQYANDVIVPSVFK